MKFNNILETIGQTPLVRLNRFGGKAAAEIYAKIEASNPTRSVKDRVALAMVEAAEQSGRLRPGMDVVVVEPTSGNTGIGLAMVCAVKGYRTLLTMPESMSVERRKLLKALGAELVLTPRERGMAGALEAAKDICAKNANACMPQQFENPANPLVHERTTALEVLDDLPDLDAFVAGVGTGGTISGVGRALRSRAAKRVLVVAVEPSGSPVLSGGQPGTHAIQGIGAGFVPKVFDRSVVDRIITVKDEDAKETARQLARREGIVAGVSSGAALFAALQIAEELGRGKKVVVVLPDSGERYLSTDLFPE
jgi:cysteine synthase A